MLINCGFISLCFSQDNRNSKPSNETKKNAITVAPVIFALYNGGIKAGFQYKTSSKTAVLTEVGLPFITKRDKYEKVQLFKINSELRLYDTKKLSCSFELGYIHRNFFDEDSGYYEFKKVSNRVRYSSTGVKSPVFTLAGKINFEFLRLGNFFMEAYHGFGIRHIRTRYSPNGGFSMPYLSRGNGYFFVPNTGWYKEGNYTKLHAATGLRAGIRF